MSADSGTPLRAPWILRAIVRMTLPSEDRDAMEHELDALYVSRVERDGTYGARWWYVRQTIGFVLRVTSVRASAVSTQLDSLPGDIRVAARSLRRRAAYAMAFIATLGIGAGVVSTVYTAARWVLLRPVPGVAHGSEIVTLSLVMPKSPPHVNWGISEPDRETLRERLTMLSDLAASTAIDVDVRLANGAPARVAGELVSTNYFSVLETRLEAGRGFTPDEGARGPRQNVMVISDALARTFDREPASLIGATVLVNGASFRIVGVAERGFRGESIPGDAQLWVPLSSLSVVDPTAEGDPFSSRGEVVWRRLIGRMRPDATPAAIAAAANGVIQSVQAEFKKHSYTALTFIYQVVPGAGLDPGVRGPVQRTLSLIALAAGLLFALAIANIANLSLVAATLRETPTAIRAALGASTGRIARELLLETTLLGVGGGVVAVTLAALSSRWFAFAKLSSYGAPLAGMHVDFRVVGFTFLVAIVAACAASLRPALLLRSGRVEQLMRRGSTSVTSRQRLRVVLVSTQMALSLVLLVAGGLLGATVKNLRRIDLGFDPNHVLTFALDPELHRLGGAGIAALGQDLERRLDAEPGIAAAGLIAPEPLSAGYVTSALYENADSSSRFIVGAGYYVTPGLLDALGARVLAGERRWGGDSGTVVITRAALNAVLPGTPPDAVIGRWLPTRRGGKKPVRISQVIDDVELSGIQGPPTPTIFHPLAERLGGMPLTGFVKLSNDRSSAATAVRRVISDRVPDIPIFDVQMARDSVDLQFSDRRVMSLAASSLSALGLLLASIGLYSVLAAAVAARQRELGIRAALGASPLDILSNIMMGGLLPATVGACLGLAGAAAVARLLRAQLFGLAPFDVEIHGVSVLVLSMVAAAASLVPARRAATLSPVDVLRSD